MFRDRLHILLKCGQCNFSKVKSADHGDLVGLTHDHNLFLPVFKKAQDLLSTKLRHS